MEEGRADDDMSDRLFVSPRSDLDPGTGPAGARRYCFMRRTALVLSAEHALVMISRECLECDRGSPRAQSLDGT